jgi:hypothetical protein
MVMVVVVMMIMMMSPDPIRRPYLGCSRAVGSGRAAS